jgi:hypothetical protein
MSVFRVLLVWLMMLALPLQGLAAASMQNCTGTSGAVNAPVSLAMGAVDGEGQVGHSHDTHDEQGLHDASVHHGDSDLHAHLAAAGAGTSEDGNGAAHKCMLCALCGHGVALNEFPTALEFGEQAHASPRAAKVLIPAAAVLVPDKPPRA